MKISREYHAHAGNYTPGGNRCRYIVVHNTGNVAGARAEARYAQNDRHPSSYHYVLDGAECFQILDDTETAWAVGAWRGNTQYISNSESISIEVCSNGTEFTPAEIAQLTELTGMLMRRHNIPAERVVRHYDCHGGPSGRKDCPAWYVDAGRWRALWRVITSGTVDDGEVKMASSIIQPDGMGVLVWIDDAGEWHGLAKPAEKDAVQAYHKQATGKELPVFAFGTKANNRARDLYNAHKRGFTF